MKKLLALTLVSIDIAPAFGQVDEGRFVKACEAALQDRLKAPSTYKRINLIRLDETLTANEYARGDQDVFDKWIKSEKKPVRHTAVITYDAANSFGVPIRGIAKCSIDTAPDKEPSGLMEDIEIDGRSNMDWLAEQIVRSRR